MAGKAVHTVTFGHGGAQPHSQTAWAGNEDRWYHTVGFRGGLEECQYVSSYVAIMVYVWFEDF